MNAVSREHPGAAPVEFVIRKVAQRFDVTPEMLVGDSRRQGLVRVRHLAMHLAAEVSAQNMTAVSRAFHRADHSTVIHAIEANQIRMERDPVLAQSFVRLKGDLTDGLHCLAGVGVAINEAMAEHDERAQVILDDALAAFRRRKELIQDAKDNLRRLAGQDPDGLLRRLAGLTLVALLWVTAPTAHAGDAELACMPRAVAIKGLQQHYGEAVLGRGLSENGLMVEVLTAPDGSWSIVATWPGGLTCILASGNSWETAPATGGPETPL